MITMLWNSLCRGRAIARAGYPNRSVVVAPATKANDICALAYEMSPTSSIT
jgi:hypothetical protein